MLSDFRKFISGGSLPKHPKKHHKPFRIHHVTLFFTGVCLIIISAFGIGYVLGGSSTDDIFIPYPQPAGQTSSIKEVKSSLGFAFSYDSDLFYTEGQAANRTDSLSGDNLSSGEKLISVSARPNPNAISSEEALSGFSIETEETGQAFDNFKTAQGHDNNDQALEDYYAPEKSEYFSYQKQSASNDEINKKKFRKVVYKQVPEFGSGAKPIYQVMWLGLNQDRPVKVQIKGLLDPEEIPDIYDQILGSLKFGAVTSPGVEPLALFGLIGDEDESEEEVLDVNAISPAVVKIYHFICGHLVLEGKAYGGDVCGASVGSGFLISSDGYIATNGHVVAKGAADILVREFLSNPALLAQFAASEGLTQQQIADGDVIASLLAKMYDLPEDKLRLENKDEVILAALGEEPVTAETEKDIRALEIKLDEDSVKEARIVGIDYEPKDLLTIEQETEDGFSASDVALLKIEVEQTPLIDLADSSLLQQNAEISLIGFPSDAENNLISNTSLSPTVTNGTISSIRQAKGSDSRLFQTDADASQGSSGGPAVSETGQAFGILTYRFKDNTQANAAKSYIRDAADLKNLISASDVTLNTESETQKHWEEGLRLFNQSRFSAALEEFKIVYDNYPSHRLVNVYGAQAQKAIKEGKDIKNTNYSLLGLVYGGIAGLVGVIIGAALIAHHHRHHQVYKKDHAEN